MSDTPIEPIPFLEADYPVRIYARRFTSNVLRDLGDQVIDVLMLSEKGKPPQCLAYRRTMPGPRAPSLNRLILAAGAGGGIEIPIDGFPVWDLDS